MDCIWSWLIISPTVASPDTGPFANSDELFLPRMLRLMTDLSSEEPPDLFNSFGKFVTGSSKSSISSIELFVELSLLEIFLCKRTWLTVKFFVTFYLRFSLLPSFFCKVKVLSCWHLCFSVWVMILSIESEVFYVSLLNFCAPFFIAFSPFAFLFMLDRIKPSLHLWLTRCPWSEKFRLRPAA